jgi:hypothetical protein
VGVNKNASNCNHANNPCNMGTGTMNNKVRRYKVITLSMYPEDLKRLKEICDITRMDNISKTARLCIKTFYNELIRRGL